jgi:hypothetical protein
MTFPFVGEAVPPDVLTLRHGTDTAQPPPRIGREVVGIASEDYRFDVEASRVERTASALEPLSDATVQIPRDVNGRVLVTHTASVASVIERRTALLCCDNVLGHRGLLSVVIPDYGRNGIDGDIPPDGVSEGIPYRH